LQHLGHDAVAKLLLRKCKEFLVRATHRVARFGVEQEVFLFHPERVHARNNCPAGTLFRYCFLTQKWPPQDIAAAGVRIDAY
jgi:hypothetical protein